MTRAASDVRLVRALLVDGGKVDTEVTPTAGGPLVASGGRPYILEAYDGRSRLDH